MATLRLIFCGTSGAFSAATLRALVLAGVTPDAVLLPAFHADVVGLRRLPAPAVAPVGRRVLTTQRAQPTIATQAHELGLPLYELGHDASAAEALCLLRPDVCAVACWPTRIAPALLDVPPLGWLNTHPSLLPRHRGPDPLFWTFHAGEAEAGVTIHRMAHTLDTGDILAQRRVSLTPGETERALEARLAAAGGALLAEAAHALGAGTATPTKQDAALATWEGWPMPQDFAIGPTWLARRAYGFVAGLGERAEPIMITVGDRAYALGEALSYEACAMPEGEWGERIEDGTLRLCRADGVLLARVR